MPRSCVLLVGALVLLAACRDDDAPSRTIIMADGGGTTENDEPEPAPTLPIAQELPCERDEDRRVDKEGTVTSCRLRDVGRFGPYSCASGKLVYVYPGKRLKECELREPLAVHGVTCREEFALYDTGELRRCRVSKAAARQGLSIPEGARVTFDREARVTRLELDEPLPVQGLLCKGAFTMFHPNGKLKKCELAKAKRIGGRHYLEGDAVCFDANGTPIDC